jgi:hypothetical protein
MSGAELNALEREVEAARARVAGDLARLHSPATLSEFKGELLAEARQSKDQLLEKSSEYVKDTAQHVLSDLKGRAAANPAAALAIGAGLAWQLLRHPPIASILVGAGIFGLMKTRPDLDADIAAGVARQAHDVSTLVTERVQSWSAEATQVAQEAAAKVVDSVSELADRVSETTATASEVARASVTQVAANASAAGQRVATDLAKGMPEKEVRDQLLLGGAALAIAAAIGIASQRRSQQDS